MKMVKGCIYRKSESVNVFVAGLISNKWGRKLVGDWERERERGSVTLLNSYPS